MDNKERLNFIKKFMIKNSFMIGIIFIGLGYLAFQKLGEGDRVVQLKDYMQKDPIIIDVRTPEEYKRGHYKDAINISHTNIMQGVIDQKIAKNSLIIVYCQSGNRSAQAYNILVKAGYTNVIDAGGYQNFLRLIS